MLVIDVFVALLLCTKVLYALLDTGQGVGRLVLLDMTLDSSHFLSDLQDFGHRYRAVAKLLKRVERNFAFVVLELAIKDLLQRIDSRCAAGTCNRSRQRNLLRTNCDAILCVAAILNPTLAHQRIEPFVA